MNKRLRRRRGRGGFPTHACGRIAIIAVDSKSAGKLPYNYCLQMSPTVWREDGFRFYFFSREEPRKHVHVQCADGEAKFWIEPSVELVTNYRLSDRQLNAIRILIEAHVNEFHRAWTRHFGS